MLSVRMLLASVTFSKGGLRLLKGRDASTSLVVKGRPEDRALRVDHECVAADTGTLPKLRSPRIALDS